MVGVVDYWIYQNKACFFIRLHFFPPLFVLVLLREPWKRRVEEITDTKGKKKRGGL